MDAPKLTNVYNFSYNNTSQIASLNNIPSLLCYSQTTQSHHSPFLPTDWLNDWLTVRTDHATVFNLPANSLLANLLTNLLNLHTRWSPLNSHSLTHSMFSIFNLHIFSNFSIFQFFFSISIFTYFQFLHYIHHYHTYMCMLVLCVIITHLWLYIEAHGQPQQRV